jgi:hypothetical protein
MPRQPRLTSAKRGPGYQCPPGTVVCRPPSMVSLAHCFDRCGTPEPHEFTVAATIRCALNTLQSTNTLEGPHMDADRFDSLARTLTAAGSRRRAFAAALSGGLGLLGLASPDDAAAARSGKCKPKCGDCEQCKKGDCKRKNGKKRCKKGKCQPLTGPACSGGRVCQAGSCVCRSGTERCGGACVARCGAATVRNPVTCGCCQVAGETCSFDGANNCCSGLCPGGTCESKFSGDACTFAEQCGTGVCRGGLCACSALREPCFQNLDCCDATTGLAGTVLCSDKDGFSGSVCCVSGTGPCVTSADCCSEFTCNSGTCSN